jgi:hypothetical protein
MFGGHRRTRIAHDWRTLLVLAPISLGRLTQYEFGHVCVWTVNTTGSGCSCMVYPPLVCALVIASAVPRRDRPLSAMTRKKCGLACF